ncbi:histone-lysine N-methyltransferase SUV39H2 [Anabrus simplex]|uniref:histone-lysine N-methyltransferase SUV39H2 n=1 Tax=Anabrus simplex TaxID=316456 RepID=UPI0035A3AA5E
MKPDEVVAFLPKTPLMSTKSPAVDTKMTESAVTGDLEEQLTNGTATPPSTMMCKIVKYNTVSKTKFLCDKLGENGIVPIHREKEKPFPDIWNGDSKEVSCVINDDSKTFKVKSPGIEHAVNDNLDHGNQTTALSSESSVNDENKGTIEDSNPESPVDKDSIDSNLSDVSTDISVPSARSLPEHSNSRRNSVELPLSGPSCVQLPRLTVRVELLKAEDCFNSEMLKKKMIKPKAKKRLSLDRALCKSVTPKKARKSAPARVRVPKPDEVYEVEKIVDHHEFPDKKIHYFVKWKNWPSESNTWEPLENLTNCEKRLKEYYDQLNEANSSSAEISNEDVDNYRLSLVDTRREILEDLMTTLMTPQGLFYPVPKEMFIQKELRALLRVPDHSRNPVDVEKVKRKLLLRALHMARSKQVKDLKEWEYEMNAVSNDTAPITVENMVDLEGPPPSFNYVNDYIPGRGVTIPEDPPIGCSCKTCDGRSKGCCSKQSGSQFAYSANRLLKVPVGSPIYECNKRCQCGPDCINRVVQRGRKVKLSVFRTATGCGWGVKALEEIKKGTFVCEYVGEVIHNDEAESRGKSYDADGRTYLFDLDYNEKEQFPYTVDAATFGNISHFINHSCSPNLAVYAVWINCLDPNLPKLALFAMQNIKEGEEVTFDYMCQSFKQQVNSTLPGGVEASPSCSRARLAFASEDSSDGELSAVSSQRIMCKCKSKHCRRYLF